MRFIPAKQLNAILQQEYFEPTISWALRVVFALNVPLLLLPYHTGHRREIVWTAFSAYLLSLLDFRGPHSQKVFIQIIESILIIVAAIIGMKVANNLWWSVIGVFIIGMFAALLRNWSDYGSAIGIAMGFFYLFGLANPVSLYEALQYAQWIAYGAGWALFITLTSFLFQTSNPLKRSVANIWKKNTELLDVIIKESLSAQSNMNIIIEKETAVRTAINKSIELFKRNTDVKNMHNSSHYNLTIELRKISSLFGASITALHEELETLNSNTFDELRASVIYKTLSAFGQASARIAIVVFTNRKEDFTLAKLRVTRCETAIKILIKSCGNLTLTTKETQHIQHFIQSLQIALDYLNQAIALLEEKINSKKSAQIEEYRMSFNNFLAGLNPYEWLQTIRILFNVNSQQFKYALRVAIVLCLGVFIYKFFDINHGYWIPLTIIIVIQPYYGATLKKGFERIVGTVAGIVVGGMLALIDLPHLFYVFLLIIVSFFIVYFIRHNYKVGVFFLTLMMVTLLHLSSMASWQLIAWRVLSTIIGAILAVGAGFAFWPVWEKQRYPVLMSKALLQNKNYLCIVIDTIHNEQQKNESWIKLRNLAEAANSDVFACVQRMHDEPSQLQENIEARISIVGTNIRITREITSIALCLSAMSNSVIKTEGLVAYKDNISTLLTNMSEVVLQNHNLIYPDFNTLMQQTQQIRLDTKDYRFIKSELEKIIFELENMCIVFGNLKV